MNEVFKIMMAGNDRRQRVTFELVDNSSNAGDAEELIKFLDCLPLATTQHLLLLMKERWSDLLTHLANNQLIPIA